MADLYNASINGNPSKRTKKHIKSNSIYSQGRLPHSENDGRGGLSICLEIHPR